MIEFTEQASNIDPTEVGNSEQSFENLTSYMQESDRKICSRHIVKI